VLFGSRERVSLALEHQLPVDPGFVIMHWRFVRRTRNLREI